MCGEKIGVSLAFLENRAIMSNIEPPALYPISFGSLAPAGLLFYLFADVGKKVCVQFFGLTIWIYIAKIKMKKLSNFLKKFEKSVDILRIVYYNIDSEREIPKRKDRKK